MLVGLIVLLILEILLAVAVWLGYRKLLAFQGQFESFREKFFGEVAGFQSDLRQLDQWATSFGEGITTVEKRLGWPLKTFLWGSSALSRWRARSKS